MNTIQPTLCFALLLAACGSTAVKYDTPLDTSVDSQPSSEPAVEEDTADTGLSEPSDSSDPNDSADDDTADTAVDDTADPEEERIACGVGTQFVAPQDQEFYVLGSNVEGVVQLDSLSDYTDYAIRFEDESEAVLSTTAVDTQGQAQYLGTDFTQSKGIQRIYARLITPDGICDSRIEKAIGVCANQLVEDFGVSPANWITHGDAYWDSGGWMEMTGVAQGRKGAVYNSQDVISSGAASIRFTLKTGNGMNGGADGFAFTIINVSNPNELVSWLDQALSGGGMGYGVGGPYGSFTGDAITVEIDTWKNNYNGSNEFHTDPTDQSHIAVTRNADASDHLVWFETPNVEDFQPHSVRVDIFGGSLKVYYDGNEVINQPVSLNFKGGQMFFSGSTGWATNYHIFDDLEILHDCQ